jgi:microcystin-dependent protein
MSSPFLGEIRVVGFNFAPRGWATCDGQLLPISQSTALFSLLGTTFGGNGTTNFGLPNFQGIVPVGSGSGAGLSPYSIGETGGTSTETITPATMPAHTHNPFYGDAELAGDASPVGDLFAGASQSTYAPLTTTQRFTPKVMQLVGENQPHENMAPFQTLLYIIAMNGVFPARN